MVISGSLNMTPMLSLLNIDVKNTKHFFLDNVHMTLHDRVREVISNSEHNQSNQAKLLKVSRSTVSQWMSGTTTPDGDNLYNLAEINGYNYKWLRDGIGPKKVLASGSGPLAKARQEVKEKDNPDYGKNNPTPVTNTDVIASLKNQASPRTRALLQRLAEIDRESGLNDEHIEILEHLVSRYESEDT